MASATYENILREVEMLTSEEQHRLLQTLIQQATNAPDAIGMMRNKLAHRMPLGEQGRVAAQEWLARVDVLAARIGAAWDDPSISAVDAVREQRREL